MHPFIRVAALAGCVSSALAQQPAQQRPDFATHHTWVADKFTFESGVTVPNVKVVFGTYGHLNAARDNVVLLPSHYMATHHGYEWLIGPGLSLDTTKLFLVATELFGNGQSSSPSNTPEPFHGPRFPVATIRDNVEAVHRLLVDSLHVTHLRAVIGFSMGAEQAFQWAVSYPDFMDRIVATSGTARAWPHGIVRLEAEISAITQDPNFNNGDYTTRPSMGVQLFGSIWAGWLYSQEWWRQELWKRGAGDTTSLETFRANFVRNFQSRADPNDLILQARTWEKHDVGTTKGFDGSTEKALASIKVPVLYMPSATDLYFPVTDAQYESKFIPKVTLHPIPSLWGHPAGAGAGPADKTFLNEEIAAFMAGTPRAATQPPAAAGTPQNPSPMAESTRKHERLVERELAGTKRTFAGPASKQVDLFVPDGVRGRDAFDLVIHFHGAAWVANQATFALDNRAVTATLNLGTGSGVYHRAFAEPAAFDTLLGQVSREVAAVTGRTARIGRVTLSGWSAGHGAIRAILLDSAHFARVDAILLIDGMHTSYVPEGKVLALGGTIDTTNLVAFTNFARAAMRGEKRFLVTHSEIFPGTFVSTTETADWVLAALGVKRAPVVKWGPRGTQQLSEAHAGRFELMGFAGNSAPDHVDLLHAMPELLARLWGR